MIDDDLSHIQTDLKSPQAALFTMFAFYGCGNWTPGEIMGAIDVINDYEKAWAEAKGKENKTKTSLSVVSPIDSMDSH